jgi:hypothetical protein
MMIVAGDYGRAVESSNSTAAITSAVLYPNDHTIPTACGVSTGLGSTFGQQGTSPEAADSNLFDDALRN